MASTIIIRHQCDRCRQVVDRESDDTTSQAVALPEGWMLIGVASQPRLLCGKCQDGLRMFLAANESVEQSR